MAVLYDHDHEQEITLFAETNFRNQRKRFGIKTDDRRRHLYILGKTGMGKTVLQENMVLADIYAGHGVCYVDPHGDTAEKILDFIPPNRINDVVYFNPADMEYPVGFNILETSNDEQKHLVASGLMGVFKKIWPDVWSPRMEYILLNCVLALLDYPGATLLGINRLLVDKEYRTRVIAKIRNPIVKTFWVAEFTSWSEKYATEAIAPVQNKVGQFLSASIIRNIVAQVKSTINPRQIMDEGKIFIVNLSKGKIGEDNMRLLGGMIVTKIQLAAMERVDIKHEDDRRDFYLFVDEFQNFANESFASVLSEARKYHLNLTVAHQYIEQLTEEVRDAVFGNVGTMIMFRVGAPDAQYLETEFTPTYLPEDLTNLAKYNIYLKLMVDGVSTAPFSANTLPPIGKRTGSEAKVIAISRERYAEPRAVIEDKVLRWSGMETSVSVSAAAAVASPDDALAAIVTGQPITASAPSSDAEATASVAYPVLRTEEEQEARDTLGGVPARFMPGTPEYAEAGRRALEGDHGEEEGEYLTISAERMAAFVKPGQQPKKEKPKFKHTCTRCGKTWDMPIQLDPSRPMYCAECLPIVREERDTKQHIVKSGPRTPPTVAAPVADQAPAERAPRRDSLASAMRAAEEDAPPATAHRETNNRPRLVVTDKRRFERLDEEDPSELVRDVERATGKQVERRKQAVMPPAPAPAPAAPSADAASATTSTAARSSQKRSRNRRRERSSPREAQPSGDHASRRSLEEVFRDADDRLPSSSPNKPTIVRATSAEESDDAPRTVFRPKPGQRVRF